MLRLVLFGLAGLAYLMPLEAQSSRECPGSAAPEITKGVRAFKQGEYADAVVHFQEAVNLDIGCTTARLYLATAYMQQYIPGADTPDNQQMASSALQQFEAVLEKDPENRLALASLASLDFNMKRLDAAETWYKRLISVAPQNKEAYYTLGVIAWTRAVAADGEARSQSGMKPYEPGPLKSDSVRADLRAKNLTVVQEGIQNLERALEIDPEYDDCMAYLNLLYRQKADMEDSPQDYQEDIHKADAWFQKTLDTRKDKASRKP